MKKREIKEPLKRQGSEVVLSDDIDDYISPYWWLLT